MSNCRADSLRFDPASGLFGLVPVHSGGDLDKPDIRRLLSQAINRDAFVGALGVPGLAPRAMVLEPGLDGIPAPVAPAWLASPFDARRAGLIAEANRLFGKTPKPAIRVELSEGPGADLLLQELSRDWGALGFTVERAPTAASADFRLVDAVAPSSSPAWFVRQFRCEITPVCDSDADTLMDSARQIAGARATLRLARPGGGQDRRCRTVPANHRAGALVARLRADLGLCREPLRRSHAHRPGAQARRRRLSRMAIVSNTKLPFPVGTDPQSVRQRVEAMERVLERLFVIPGINRPVGLDVILDVVPVVGDIAAAALGAYIVWEGRNVGMSKWQMSRMAGNVGFDWLLGLIPFVGAIPDFFFRSNTRNLRMIKRHLDKHHAETATIEGTVTRPQ